MVHDWEPLEKEEEFVVCGKCGTVVNEIDASREEWEGDCTPDSFLTEGD